MLPQMMPLPWILIFFLLLFSLLSFMIFMNFSSSYDTPVLPKKVKFLGSSFSW